MKKALALAIALAALVTAIYVWTAQETEVDPQNQELCEVGVVNKDGTVSYTQNHPGQTDLLVLATQNGIRIYAPCR